MTVLISVCDVYFVNANGVIHFPLCKSVKFNLLCGFCIECLHFFTSHQSDANKYDCFIKLISFLVGLVYN
jgi:hypothetical protein